MLMLSHAKSISREALASVPTPAPTDTWRPVPHSEVVSALAERANALGLHIAEERYAVLDGTLYPESGVQVPLPGARLFGSIDFEPIPGVPFPNGCRPSAGLRNSHDKSFALSILAGSGVLVCANGLLLAEHVINRKHTSGISLQDEIDRALNAFIESVREFQTVYNALSMTRLTKPRASHVVVELARAGAFPSSDILPVLKEWDEPRHPEFRGRTAWTLHQAATEVMKGQGPARQVEGFKALSRGMLALAS